MIITGDALIGGQAVKGTGAGVRAYNPTQQQVMEPEFRTVDARRSTRPAAWPKMRSIPSAR
jgi:hypothetical protein